MKPGQEGRSKMFTAEMIEYYSNKPVDFTKDIIRATPYDYQGDILSSIVTKQKTAVKSGHGTGKSAMESWVILWFLATRPFPKIPCTAPTQHQLYDILWAELSKWLRQSLLEGIFSWTASKLYFNLHPEEWFAVARTASTPESLQGFHAEHLLFVIDEAPGVEDDIYQPVIGALSGVNNKLLMCGNPTKRNGFFFDAFNVDASLYNLFTLNSEDSPLVSKEYCEFIARKWGKDSDVYRVRVLGLFPKSNPDAFIPADWIEQVMKKRIIINFTPKIIQIGVDIARYGDDSTVLATRFDNKLQDLEQHRKEGTTQTTGHVIRRVKKLHGQYPYHKIRVATDDGGLGGGVTDQLIEQKREQKLTYMEVLPVNFGSSSDDEDFADKGGEIWGNIRDLLEYEEIELPYDDELLSQFSNRIYTVNSKGLIVLERKQDMKKRGLGSPDKADATALAFYEPKKRKARAATYRQGMR